MEFKDIAAVAGKSGLFRVVKPTKTGVILESIDEKKSRLVAGAHQRVSILEEVSIYTTGKDGSQPLKKVFKKIQEEFGDDPGVESNSDSEELKAFVKHILPDYDEERVYISDIKKIINWYNILNKFPDIFKEIQSDEKS